ncbi:MAG: M16 family metallopeptidase [Hyphomicrobiaceae bacterium]
MTLALAPTAFATDGKSRVTEFKLDNGMEVIVVPDNRAPVVTHMVWYRAGAADEPPGVSGIAHFLEHLMFKTTEKIPSGEFPKIVARLGGQDNAFTSQDATAYFQRVAKEHLPRMMEMEAERMVNLRLVESEVLTERDVILEERRSRVDNSPSALLDEQMDAALYKNHPYGIPVIGWEHEMARLSREDALAFYKRFYAPNNAILVVSGDVTPELVKDLAEKTYGKLPANPAVGGQRVRPQEPKFSVARRLALSDPRAGQPTLYRYYLAPSYQTAPNGDAEALDILVKILAEGSTSRIYKSLVVEDRIASSASGGYYGGGLDSGKIVLHAVAAPGSDLDRVEKRLDEVIADVKANGVTEEALARAKSSYIADFVYESDNQATLARRYGWGRSVGRTVAEIDALPERIRKVTLDDVKRVAGLYLDISQSVTGTLTPSPRATADAPIAGAKAPAAEGGAGSSQPAARPRS